MYKNIKASQEYSGITNIFFIFSVLCLVLLQILTGCNKTTSDIRSLAQLEGGKTFAVPTGTVADQSVLKRFPDARITYYNSVYDCALAVQNKKADAAVYDRPVLKNIAAKNSGLTVLDELLFPDYYGFAVAKDNVSLKEAMDKTLATIKEAGVYDEMISRWLPDKGDPGPMPAIANDGSSGVLVFGTAAVTEPMSFYDGSQQVVGFDIEFALRIAASLNKRLEVVSLEFGAMLPALIAGKVDMIGAGLSITEERAKSVLFSESYYESGIAALVRLPEDAGQDVAKRSENDGNAGNIGVKSDEASGIAKSQRTDYKELGVIMGSIHEVYANKTYPNAIIRSYNSVPDMLLALSGKKIEAAFIDNTGAREILSTNPNFTILEQNLFSVDIGAGFQLQADQFRETFNSFLSEIKGDGTYADMKKRWMTDLNTDMPDIKAESPTGTIKVGFVSDIGLPFSARIGNRYVGFDIELSSRFAAWSGKSVELVDMHFGSLIPSLVTGKIDMITASMMITEERSMKIDFSDPYHASGVSILGLLGSGEAVGDVKNHHIVEPSFVAKLADGFHNNIIREKRYMMILRGLMVTIIISIFAALTGTVLGGVVCFMRMSKNALLRTIASYYISLIRGTPVLVLLMIIYYVVFASVNINPVLVAVIAFGINFAAYVSEMFRTSIQSVDRGQKEAGIASGFTKVQTFIYIIMPQAMRQVLPVYKGEFISLVKMTSIVGYIAVEDLTKASDIIRSRTFDAFFPLIMAAVIYIFIAWLLTLILDHIEVGVDPVKRRLSARKEVVK